MPSPCRLPPHHPSLSAPITARFGNSRRKPRRNESGFTILELVVVVAIVMILTAIGIVQSQDMIPRFRTRRAAMTFSSLVNQCRSLAIQTNRECSVWLLDYDSDLSNLSGNAGAYWVGIGNRSMNSTTWDYLPADGLADGSDDDVSLGTVDLADSSNAYYARHVSMETWGSLAGPGSTNTDRIVLDPRGFVRNPVTDFDGDGYITVTFVNKVARSQGRIEDFTVRVSRSGMTRVDNSISETFVGTPSGTPLSSSDS